jgi:hypothetical protein
MKMELLPWNEKYWDMIDNIYGTPRFLGFKPIRREEWKIAGDLISIPRAGVNIRSPLYSRKIKPADIRDFLSGQEEILNHFFNIAFSIADDDVISRLFCRPFGIDDAGPFASRGREIWSLYGWGQGENVTQLDSFFVTNKSLIGIELKLNSTSWPEQVAKYAAVMRWEEKKSGGVTI